MRLSPRTSSIAIALALAVTACGKHEAPVPPASAPAAAPTSVVAYSPPASLATGGVCALDAVNGAAPAASAATAATQGSTVFAGWVGDDAGNVPRDAMLVLTSPAATFSSPLTAGGDRPDVAAALGKEGLRTSGFNLSTMLASVPAGSYVLSIVQGGAAPKACPLNVTLSVSG